VTTDRRTLLGLLALTLPTAGCVSGTTTLFQSGFNSNSIGAPPAAIQTTGTVQVFGPPGSVVISGPPPQANGNWLAVSRVAGPAAPIAGMEGDFARHPGVGTYSFLGVLYIPKGTGAATIEFDTSPQTSPPVAQFLHLDFLPNDTVRVDDNGQAVFGSFQHDQFFTLSVKLDVFSVCTVAHMTLFGTGASGSLDYRVPLSNLAPQIGALKVWMGFPWGGTFKATDLLVTYQPPGNRLSNIQVPPECVVGTR
jgi:hypothetical protein